MLSFADDRWLDLKGGYRMQFDPRPLLLQLESGQDVAAAWHQLWEQLHHQGDVGEASYAAVPHLVRIYRQSGVVDWNTFGIVALIELRRGQGNNPEVPKWLEEGYFAAIRELAATGVAQLSKASEPEDIRGILSVLAIQKGARIHGRFLLEYSDQELLDIESQTEEP